MDYKTIQDERQKRINNQLRRAGIMNCTVCKCSMVRATEKDYFTDEAKHEGYRCLTCGVESYNVITEEAKLKDHMLTEE